MNWSGTEASKYKLFIHGQEDANFEKKHKCSAIMNMREGQLTNIDEEPMFDYLPDKVEMFIGREIEMYEIIKLLHKGRVVSILGPPGIGKSSISRNLGHYFRGRKQFKDGIIYVKLRGCKSSQMFITHLSLSIRAALGESELDKLEALEDEDDIIEDILVMKKHHSTINDKKEVKDATLDILKTKNVLIILDN
jgi:ABC-type phosphate transport system ATPase subunit